MLEFFLYLVDVWGMSVEAYGFIGMFLPFILVFLLIALAGQVMNRKLIESYSK